MLIGPMEWIRPPGTHTITSSVGEELMQQDVARTGRNTTGPLCSRGAIIRLEAA